mmetsp:Transcript_32161/g.49185  ORF Transcript_32161/g.49185 Transcript_32161/m.49185 type:complete len:112 (-) Transcript_32161:392-727(-)
MRQKKKEGELFFIEKARHFKPPVPPLKGCTLEEEAEESQANSYAKWKHDLVARQPSFHKSLGFSVKMSREPSISFKSKIKYIPDVENDSATSGRVSNIEDTLYNFQRSELS